MPAGITAVTDRIRSIEQQFATRAESAHASPAAPLSASSMSPGGVSAPTFDPFGDAYDRAVAAAGRLHSSFHGSYQGSDGSFAESIGTRGSVGGYGSMPVPPALAPYGNGRIPADVLVPIAQSGHRLYAPAAAAWDRLVDAAAQEGVQLRITDSYRSYEEQVDLANRKGLYRDGGLAAVPGTSNHGWGLAVDADVTDPSALAWLRQNAARFGYVETVPREPWHWEFRPHQV